MPFLLSPIDDTSEYERYSSVLIIPCRFCPAASSAVLKNEPYFEIFRAFLKTRSYESFISKLKDKLSQKGVRVDIFRSRWLHQFVLCMWTSRRREKLKKIAKNYDALVVLGCEAAITTVREAIKPSDCDIIQGVKTEGIMSVKPKLGLPCNLSLEPHSLSLYDYRDDQRWIEAD